MKIEAADLCYVYPDGTRALKNINFVADRECVALLGANGAGKSTLLQHFNGLLVPTSGEVLANGEKVNGTTKRSVGMLFQSPDDQLFEATVEKDVAYGPRNFGAQNGEAEKAVTASLKLMRLEGFEKRAINQLSYGEKKRVAIAGILALNPKVLALDEPTSGLDPKIASDLLELLLGLKDERTIIIATHDVDAVPIFADRVYVLDSGRIVLHGTPQEVFRSKNLLRKSGLRLPRIAHLFEVAKKENLPLTIGEARRLLEDEK